MTDHGDPSAPHSHHDQGLHSPTLSITASLIRLTASTAKAAGYSKTADWLIGWPELVGTKLGTLILNLRGKADSGEVITAADEASLEQALIEQPQGAAQLLAFALASTVNGIPDAETETHEILSSYVSVLGLVTSAMNQLHTSYALRGFLHDPDCVSYWHYKRGSIPSWGAAKNESIYPLGFDIYFIRIEPSDDNLAGLNEAIVRADDRTLRKNFQDYRANPVISKLERVRSHRVEVFRMATEEEKQPRSIFESESSSHIPRSFEYEIPFGAPPMLQLFESFLTAQTVQGGARKAVLNTKSSIDQMLQNLPSADNKTR